MINFDAERTAITVPGNRGGGRHHGMIWLSKTYNHKGPIPNRINFARVLCEKAGIKPNDRVDLQYSEDAIFLSKHEVGILTMRHSSTPRTTENTALIIVNTFALASLEAWCKRRYGKSLTDITYFEYEIRDGVIGFVPVFADESEAA